MKKRSKRYKKIREMTKGKEIKNIELAITEIKNIAGTKFNESIDLSFKANIKKIKGQENNIRTVVELPNGNGKN